MNETLLQSSASDVSLNIRSKVYFVIAFAICSGNLLVLLFFYQKRRKVFRRAYNYIVLALSVTDLLTGIKLFFSRYMSYTVVLQPTHLVALTFFCELVWGSSILFFFAILSMYLCVLLAAERWFATIRPVQHRNASTKRRLALGCFIVFCMAFLTVALTYQPYSYHPKNPPTQRCVRVPRSTTRSKLSVTMGVLMKTIISFSVISILYLHIAYKIKKSPFLNPALSQRKAEAILNNKFTKLACITTLTMFLCWFPSQIIFLLVTYNQVSHSHTIQSYSAAIVCLNSALNPFLYGFALKEYRNGYWETIRRLFSCVACKQRSAVVVPIVLVRRGVVQAKENTSMEVL